MHVFMAMLGVAMLIMVGMAALLSLVLLVLWEVRGVVRLSHDLARPEGPPRSPWQFSDCGQPAPLPGSYHANGQR